MAWDAFPEGRFVAQARRPAALREVDPAVLGARQRELLVHDGTVTRLLEETVGEPVEVVPLDQRPAGSGGGPLAPWLDGAAEPLRRRVAIRGVRSGETLVWAESLLAPARLPPDFLARLAADPHGLGCALAAAGLETRRELLWYGAGPAARWTRADGELLTRAYRVLVAARPAIVIAESFPLP